MWSLATFGGLVQKTFLADPVAMLRSGWTLLAEMGFAKDIGMTVFRSSAASPSPRCWPCRWAWRWARVKPVEAFFEPFVSFARYLPASAFIPLLILWAGIGEAQKLAVIFIGSFFSAGADDLRHGGNTRRDLVEAAYTLGVSDTAG